MELDVRHIDLSMGEGKRARTVLGDVSFSVPDGAFCSLLGESGAGKSTILKVIAGILLQDGGSVLFDGAPVDGLPAHRRGIGFVFQDVRLFPHMTVEENVAYPLRMAGVGKRERLARAGCRRFPAVRRSAWRWPALLRRRPRPCCSTSPSRGSMRACATICARFCCACIERTA